MAEQIQLLEEYEVVHVPETGQPATSSWRYKVVMVSCGCRKKFSSHKKLSNVEVAVEALARHCCTVVAAS